jgi:hypothetical protein
MIVMALLKSWFVGFALMWISTLGKKLVAGVATVITYFCGAWFLGVEPDALIMLAGLSTVFSLYQFQISPGAKKEKKDGKDGKAEGGDAKNEKNDKHGKCDKSERKKGSALMQSKEHHSSDEKRTGSTTGDMLSRIFDIDDDNDDDDDGDNDDSGNESNESKPVARAWQPQQNASANAVFAIDEQPGRFNHVTIASVNHYLPCFCYQAITFASVNHYLPCLCYQTLTLFYFFVPYQDGRLAITVVVAVAVAVVVAVAVAVAVTVAMAVAAMVAVAVAAVVAARHTAVALESSTVCRRRGTATAAASANVRARTTMTTTTTTTTTTIPLRSRTTFKTLVMPMTWRKE